MNELNEYAVTPLCSPVDLLLEVPGSKSITNRALLLAALADGMSTLSGVLFSDDSKHFLQCLIDLGFPISINRADKTIVIQGFGGKVPKKEAQLYVGSAGTAARFLTAMLSFTDGIYTIHSSPQMKKRPMKPLLSSLEAVGVKIIYHEKEGFFPFTIYGNSTPQNSITVDIENSSQFLSALLIAAPLIKNGLSIQLVGKTHALSYVNITRKMMQSFGVSVEQPSSTQYYIQENQSYQAIHYQIEPDVSAACYFYAMVPLLGGRVLIRHIHTDTMQGDIQFLSFLEEMGCQITDTKDGIEVQHCGNKSFPGICADMGACSDQAMTLAALAPFAQTPTKISHILHIQYQETNRIEAILTELQHLGIRCEKHESGITIYPGTPNGNTIETYEDHRMAMAFSLIGLKIPGIIIKNPLCCKKTFEEYFSYLNQIIQNYGNYHQFIQ